MKKTFFLLFLGVAMSASAQFTLSVNTGFNRAGVHNDYTEYSYSISPTLRAGYRLNERLAVGITAGIGFEKYYSIHYGPENADIPFSSRKQENNLSWNAGAYARYDFPVTEHLSLFADLAVTLGSNYSRSVREYYRSNIWNYTPGDSLYKYDSETHSGDYAIFFCGATLTPGVSYRFNSHIALDLHLDLLHLAYTHVAVTPKDGEMTTRYDSFCTGLEYYYYPSSYYYMNLDFFSFQPTGYNNPRFRIGVTYTF